MSVLEQVHDLLKEKYPNITIEVLEKIEQGLRAYGYLNGGTINRDDFIEATKEFQKFAGVDVDGEFGSKTVKAFFAPRCGCRDVEYIKEDASNPSRWGLKHIKWYVQDYLDEFTKDEYSAIIKHGFDYTSKYIDLTFEQVKNANGANLIFTASDNPRDDAGTPGQVLAWAELPSKPNFVGQLLICMDKAEDWRGPNDTKRGIKVLNVLNHESCAGHSLGLVHSKVQTALLAPIYNVNVVYPQENDDLSRLRGLYGAAQAQPPVNPEPPASAEETVNMTIKGENLKINIPGYRVIKI